MNLPERIKKLLTDLEVEVNAKNMGLVSDAFDVEYILGYDEGAEKGPFVDGETIQCD